MTKPLVTIAVPSLNQGRFLNDALSSIFQQELPVEVFVHDGGSSDNSLEIIRQCQDRLAGWRSYPDHGQGAAINEAIAKGKAPYVCWLNSDDYFLPGALTKLIHNLEQQAKAPAVYGCTWDLRQKTAKFKSSWVEAWNEKRLAVRCIVSQPATLIRRSAWEAVGGLDPSLVLAMDYDLWWRLSKQCGPMHFIEDFLAVNREHQATKTKTQRRRHYQEAIAVVRKHYGKVPLKWWLAQPYAVWFKSLISYMERA